MERAKNEGAKIVKQLNVGGAFHSPLMESAVANLAETVEQTNIKVPVFPVYSNVTGTPFSSPQQIKDSLIKQITSPVLWYPSIMNMSQDGAHKFIEVGAGKVLQGLMKRISKNSETAGIDTVTDSESQDGE